MLDGQDRLALDGAFKRVNRAQAAIGRLADDGVEITMTHGDQAQWSGYIERLSAARAESDAALDALIALHRSLVPAEPSG
jgi:ribonuclease HI